MAMVTVSMLLPTIHMVATVLSTEAPKDLLAMAAIMERGKLNQDMATEVEATSTEQLKV